MVAELFRRPRGARGPYLADDVAARLCTTSAVAQHKVALAIGLDRLPAVADALSTGEVDARRATVLAEELHPLPDDMARDVAAEALSRARTCTAPQLRARLRRLEPLRDPGAAERRHVAAREERRAELTPAPDAMAWLAAYLPAEDATALHTTLTALAGDSSADDPRTLDQRRADALVDVATRGSTPVSTPTARRSPPGTAGGPTWRSRRRPPVSSA